MLVGDPATGRNGYCCPNAKELQEPSSNTETAQDASPPRAAHDKIEENPTMAKIDIQRQQRTRRVIGSDPPRISICANSAEHRPKKPAALDGNGTCKFPAHRASPPSMSVRRCSWISATCSSRAMPSMMSEKRLSF